MNEYERGFADGEQQAFRDAAEGLKPRSRPIAQFGPYALGWWDGYTPRSTTWAVRPNKFHGMDVPR